MAVMEGWKLLIEIGGSQEWEGRRGGGVDFIMGGGGGFLKSFYIFYEDPPILPTSILFQILSNRPPLQFRKTYRFPLI